MTRQDLERLFPQLVNTAYQISSPFDENYNCISYAAQDGEGRWWWPDEAGENYWPADVPREETAEAFLKAFERIGYVECLSPELEVEFQKIAIFADRRGVPTHAARQLSDGSWTSKLGKSEDIIHELAALEDVMRGQTVYGTVMKIMRRPRS